jgi:F0F1-type ATP synthase assembly protein I
MQAAVGQLPLERIPATFPGDDRKRVEQRYLRSAGVGVQYALTILVLTMAGIWLDNKFETSPLFLVICLFVAFVGATWSLVQQVLAPDKKKPGDNKPGKKQ